MGLRFRKSFKIAPGVKVNLNKKSNSITFGEKGAHYTLNSKGDRTSSVGIPGTGVYYTKTSKGSKTNHVGKSSSSKSGRKKKGGCLIPIVVVVFMFIAIAALSGNKDDLRSIELSADTSTTYDINQAVTVNMEVNPSGYDIPDSAYKSTGGSISFSDGILNFTSDSSGTFDVWVEDNDIKSNTLTFTIEDKAAIAAQQQAEAEAQAQAAAQAEAEPQQPQEQMVWIPQSGSKYHSSSTCSGMNNPRQVTLSEAESMGYEPCQKCY